MGQTPESSWYVVQNAFTHVVLPHERLSPASQSSTGTAFLS